MMLKCKVHTMCPAMSSNMNQHLMGCRSEVVRLNETSSILERRFGNVNGGYGILVPRQLKTIHWRSSWNGVNQQNDVNQQWKSSCNLY